MVETPRKKYFADILPPPRFLEMPSAGLDISDERIRFLEIVNGKNGLVFGRYGEKNISPGIISMGRIKNLPELRKILINLKDEHNLDFVRVSLPEERAYLVKIDVPKVPESELRESIGFQLEEHVPIPADEAVFDYLAIKESKTKKEFLEVAVSAIPKKEMDVYLELFQGTGLTPLSFEIEADAIGRAVIPAGDKGTYMVMDFGKNRSGIYIVSEGATRFTSTIDIGSEAITKIIKNHLGVTSAAEVEKIKNERGLSKSKDNQELFSALLETVSVFRDEINKHYLYWHNYEQSGGDKSIQKIILSGGGANLLGLPEYLSASLKVPVEIGNPWINLNSFDRYIPPITKNKSLGYATVAGLALRGYLEERL